MARILGTVLNFVPVRKRKKYGYGYEYGYGYGYGYGYSGGYYDWLKSYYWQADPPRNYRLSVTYKF